MSSSSGSGTSLYDHMVVEAVLTIFRLPNRKPEDDAALRSLLATVSQVTGRNQFRWGNTTVVVAPDGTWRVGT